MELLFAAIVPDPSFSFGLSVGIAWGLLVAAWESRLPPVEVSP